jgi:pSer/pThr/pTyr-binding forkhead associated (FHA) protein/RNA polymerase subunit RPABC4/transcription elongation factor Spt4
MDVGLVCDACSALTPIGVPQCKRCGAAVALDPRPRATSKPAQVLSPPPAEPAEAPAGKPAAPAAKPADDDDLVACSRCATQVATNNRFCPNCGARVVVPTFDVQTRVGPRPGGSQAVSSDVVRPTPKPGRSTLFFGGAVQAARAKLTLIRGDGEDGVSFTLAGQEHLAGRGDCPISFPDDPFLSPKHANFIYAANQLVVRDEGSLNGVFVRISGTSELTASGTVLVGEQVLTVGRASPVEDAPDQDGTYYSASIVRPAVFEIRQNLRGGQIGWVYRPEGEVVTIGREGNDINFADDPFISGHHAELRLSGGVLSVTDLGSRNGTFIRINGERVLKHGDYVFLGQQLLRVEIV